MRSLIVIVAAIIACPAAAQDLGSLLNNPQPKTLKDLGATWYRLVVRDSGAKSASGLAAAYQGDQSTFTCYTQGRFLDLDGRKYLIGYRVAKSGMDASVIARMFESNAPPDANPFEALFPKHTPETGLSLVLIAAESLAEASEIRPFALADEIGQADMSGMSPVMTLAAVLYPVFAQAREKARQTSSLSNLKQIGLAALMYCQDWDEVLPPMKDLATAKKALMPYVKDQKVFIDPSTQKPYQTNPRMSKKALAAIVDPVRTVLFYEGQQARDGKRGAVFVDGHAKRLSASEWAAVKRKSGIP